MNITAQILLVVSNLILTAAVSYHVYRATVVLVPAPAPSPLVALNPLPPATPLVPAAPVLFDLLPLQKPLETLDQSVNRLTLTLQRFNTTAMQYEYLQTEVERLTRIDQTLATRINEARRSPAKVQTAEFEKGLKQLKTLQDQVQAEIKRRRETLGQLIDGLERQLDAQMPAKKTVVNDPANSSTPKLVKPSSSAPSPDLKSTTSPSQNPAK